MPSSDSTLPGILLLEQVLKDHFHNHCTAHKEYIEKIIRPVDDIQNRKHGKTRHHHQHDAADDPCRRPVLIRNLSMARLIPDFTETAIIPSLQAFLMHTYLHDSCVKNHVTVSIYYQSFENERQASGLSQ